MPAVRVHCVLQPRQSGRCWVNSLPAALQGHRQRRADLPGWLNTAGSHRRNENAGAESELRLLTKERREGGGVEFLPTIFVKAN